LGCGDTGSFKEKALLKHRNITAHTIGEAAARTEVILLAASP
jgi:hypothetical protein